MLSNAKNITYKIPILLALAFALITITGIISNLINMQSSLMVFPLWIILIVVSVVSGCCFIRMLFSLIDKIKRQYLIGFSILFFIGIILLLLINCMRIAPTGDSFDDVDTAFYLLSHDKVEQDIVHAPFMRLYGNNYMLILFIMLVMKALTFLGISDYLYALYYLNAIAILISYFILYLIVRITKDERCANKTLLFAAMNPVFYGLVFWIYSLIISLPIMMSGLLLAIMIMKTDRLSKRIVLAILEGIVVFLGYAIRPTAIFPAIAVFCILLFRKSGKGISLCLLTMLVAASLYFIWKGICNSFFCEFQDKNLPISYWLTIGSHGDGTLATQNQKDMSYLLNLEPQKKMKEGLRITAEYYLENGFLNTMRLWLRKIIITWSDGYSGISDRMMVGQTDSRIYSYIAGDKNAVLVYYSSIYRLVILISIVSYCIRSLRDRREQYEMSIYSIALLTLLGGYLFYVLWEAKNVYSAPFIPFMIIIASYALSSWNPLRTNTGNTGKKTGKLLLFIYSLVVLVVLTGLFICLSNEKGSDDRYVQGLRNNRAIIPIEEDITQNFVTRERFNTISISASQITDNDVSQYSMTLCNANGDVVYESIFDASMIKDGRITFELNRDMDKGDYSLMIRKTDDNLASIQFFTADTYFLDLYKGELTGPKYEYTSDLMMDVFYKNIGPKYSLVFTAIICTFALAVFASPVVMICSRNKRYVTPR